ncbi:FAD-binding Berberine family protein [Striga asiatica]|uniref:FAD-binding Berberine family protein n=1 Tax=Striga asiatica TaxID=4170 RepID=A0A5A7NZX4_STRAF|nr:FAD-binding Berberine family protein [Striga asiatica]
MMRIHIHPILLSLLLITLTTILQPPAATYPCPPPRPPPPPSNLTPEAFHRCLNRRPESSSRIPFSTIYAPTINPTSFSSLLNSTAQNLRCLSPSIPKPFLIFTPLHESHVSPAVTCARDLHLDLRVRSGGHDYECLSYISLLPHRPPFILLDLQHLRHVSVDVATRTAWVQSGATIGELYYHVAESSRGTLAFPAGLYGSIGIGGHITGGAYGGLMRAHGLGVDNALAALVVTADGRLVVASAAAYPDLFWAVRGGGGGNFGVILAWKLRLVTVPPKVTVFNAARPLNRIGIGILDRWQKVAHEMDNRTFIRVLMQSAAGDDPISVYNAVFLGKRDELLGVMRRSFPELGLDESECAEMTWIESVVFTGGYVNGTKPEYLLTGKPAFGMIQYVVSWSDAESLEAEAKNTEFMRRVYETMGRYIPSGGRAREAYVNYKDLDIGRSSNCDDSNCSCPYLWGPKYYLSNFDRLIRVKESPNYTMRIHPIFLSLALITLTTILQPPAATYPCPPPRPPPLQPNPTPEAFHRCLNRQPESSSRIPFSTIYSPTINPTSFSSLLNSTAQNLRCLSPSIPKPFLIFTPLHESHVSPAVTCARDLHLDLRVRSGGHDYECLSYISLLPHRPPFILLDLQHLRHVSVDVATRTAWVQSGATIGELYYHVAESSRGTLAFPAGLYGSVGIGGHITGGAYGALMRAHGLGVDNALAARVVTADGRLIVASAAAYPDLFWAVRGGGGGNFGVILAWKLRLVTVPTKVTVFNAARPLNRFGIGILDRWQKVAHEIDNRTFIRVLTQSAAGDEPISVYNAVFLGKRDELLRVMRRSFPELGLDDSECAEMTWIESVVFTGGYVNGTKPEYLLTGKPAFVSAFKAKSDFPRGNMPVEGLEKLVDFHRRREFKFSLLTIWNPFGGAMASVGEEDTPYPHRKVQGMIQYVVSWSDAESLEAEAKNTEFMRRVYETMGRYIPSGGRAREAYVNYKDLDIGRSSNCDDSNCSCPYLWGPKYYLSNFDRLIRVKGKVDPCNFFRFEQSVPISTSSERQCLQLI